MPDLPALPSLPSIGAFGGSALASVDSPIRRLTPPQSQLSGGTSPSSPNTKYTVSSNSPYATDLLPYHYKFPFLYVVNFRFDTEVVGVGRHNFALLTVKCDRPDVIFETKEINRYGIRTKIPVKASYTPISMTFHDDNQNQMMEFFTTASRWMSPVTTFSDTEDVNEAQYDFRLNKALSLDGVYKARPTQNPHSYAQSVNPQPFIRGMEIYHVYEFGKLYNYYNIINPVLTELKLSNLDMTSNTPADMSLKLSYGQFNVEIGKDMTRAVSELVDATAYHLRRDLG